MSLSNTAATAHRAGIRPAGRSSQCEGRSFDGIGPGVTATSVEGQFVVDARQRIIQWSASAAALTGVSADHALSRPCYEVVGGLDDFGRPACRSGCPAFAALRAGHLVGHCATPARHDTSPSTRLHCELHALPSATGGAVGRLFVEESESDRSGVAGGADILGDLAALATLASSLTIADFPTGVERALDILCDATGTESAELFLTEPAGHDMLLTTYRGPFRSAFCQMVRFAPGEGFPGRVLVEQRPTGTNALEEDDRYLRSRVKAKGYRSYLCVPLTVPEGVIGAVCLSSRDPDVSLPAAERLLTWASTPIATALQAGLLQVREQVRAGTIAPVIVDDREPDALLERVLRHTLTKAEADGGAIALFGNGGGVARRVAAGDAVDIRCPALSGGACGCPALDGQHGVALFGARASWPVACRRARSLGAMHYCLPMQDGGESIGVIQLVYRDAAPTPPTRHLRILLEVADQAASLARLARDREEARRTAESTMLRLLQSRSTVMELLPAEGEPLLRVRCFGRFEIERDGALVAPETFKRRKALTLLKILLTHADRPVSIETLTEWLWPESDPRAAANRLYVVVHALREAIEPAGAHGDWSFVRTNGDQYLFDTSDCWVDLVEYRAALDAGRQAESAGEPERALAAYDAATRLYRGDLLEDDPFDEWCLMEREHLRETYLDALHGVAVLSRERGEIDRAIDAYRRVLQVDPLREESQRQLIETLSNAGRRAEALRQYEHLRALLRRELDITPMPETEDIVQRIRAATPQSGRVADSL